MHISHGIHPQHQLKKKSNSKKVQQKQPQRRNVNASQDQIGTKLDESIKSKLLVNYTVPYEGTKSRVWMSPHINTWLPKWRVKLQSFHFNIDSSTTCCRTGTSTYYDLYKTFFHPNVSFPPSQAIIKRTTGKEHQLLIIITTTTTALEFKSCGSFPKWCLYYVATGNFHRPSDTLTNVLWTSLWSCC